MRMATCHPDKRHIAFDLCQNCYDSVRYRVRPGRKVKAAVSARKHYIEIKRGRELENLYGITETQYQEMFVAQKGLCAICQKPPKPTERLAVDHNHKTNQVRGLLHRTCNTAIGFLDDDPTLLQQAVDYLQRYDTVGETK